jgi:pimeloyl-ACP methyl ester carboxylesterase
MVSVQSYTIAVQDRPCRYWAGGPPEAPWLVLLHGGLGDAALHWHHNFADLARDFRVLAPDLPGFGRTAPLPQPTWVAYGAWVAAFCAAAGAARDLTVVGNSMGAAVARLFAAAYPARVARLVLVDGGRPLQVSPLIARLVAIPPLGAPARILLERLATTDRAMRRYIADPAYLTPRLKAGMARGIRAYIRVQSQMAATPPVPPTALRVACPVLVLWGAQDGLGAPALGRALAEQMDAQALAVLDRAGHMPMLEQPAAFGRAIRRFVVPS